MQTTRRSNQRYFAVGAPHSEPWQLALPPAKGHLAVYTPAAPRGPLALVAPLRATRGRSLALPWRSVVIKM